MRILSYLFIICSIIYSQPKVTLLYPKDYYDAISEATVISPHLYYFHKPCLSQPLNPYNEIIRFEIEDTISDSIYFKPINCLYTFWDTVTGPWPLCHDYWLCKYDTSFCPCTLVFYINRICPPSNTFRFCEPERVAKYYGFNACPPETISPDTILPFYISTNLRLIRISPHIWNLIIGAWYNKDVGLDIGGTAISPICDDLGYCTRYHSWGGNYVMMFSKPTFQIDNKHPINGSTYNILPSAIYLDIACSDGDFFALDSTSAWFVIRFETITGDTFIDTVRYGDPGTFWIVPPGKHIGWRRFGVMTMYTDIPSRGYTGVVEVCLMDVTNAPVIAFGEPTHLHPEGVSCYEDWVYVDSVTGDTTVIPDIIPAPPEPVCWRFGLISEVSEAERAEDRLNLEVVGGYLSPIQVFYKISGVGHLELYDITGKVVLRRAISAKGSEKIGVDKLNSGVYFIRVVNGKRSVVRKVLVVR